MIDKLIEAINEVMVDATVDYPAGERAGPRVEYDHDRMVSALQSVLPPADFVWIDKPANIRGEDFTYPGRVLCSFPKRNGKVRYIVEDRGRLFIQRESQLQWHDEPNQTIGEALELQHNRVLEGLGPKPEDPVTLARPSPSGSGCPECGYFHPPDGMCI